MRKEIRTKRRLLIQPLEPRHVFDASFDWYTAEKTIAENGHIVIPNSYAQAHGATELVYLDATQYQLPSGAHPTRLRFQVADDAGGNFNSEPEPTADPFVYSLALPAGRFDVTMIASTDEEREEVTETIEPRNLLFYALGDSYSSGEGNPEFGRDAASSDPAGADAQWMRAGSDGTWTEMDREHRIAHRSSYAAPAQVALQLERADPHTSVTFQFLAMSGATIAQGGIGDYAGLEHEQGYDESHPMLAQLTQLKKLAGDRQPDLVMLSFGGNDIGFSRIISSLLVTDFGEERFADSFAPKLSTAVASGRSEDWENVKGDLPLLARFAFPTTNLAGLDGLDSGFAQLATGLNEVNAKHVVITSYPNPSFELGADGNPRISSSILSDAAPGLLPLLVGQTSAEVNQQELEWVTEFVVPRLNEQLRRAAETHQWEYVDGVDEVFRGHGYSSPAAIVDSSGASEDAPGARWFVTAAESAATQGPDWPFVSTLVTTGTVHPNRLGHAAIAKLTEAVVEPLLIPAPSPIDVMHVQRRLDELGYSGCDGAPIAFSGTLDSDTRCGLATFRAATTGAVYDTTSADENLGWLDSISAPHWVELEAAPGLTIAPAVDGGKQMESWATSWGAAIVYAAAARVDPANPLQLRAASLRQGGPSVYHQNEGAEAHVAGLGVDFENSATNDGTIPFYATRTIAGVQYVAARDGRIIIRGPDNSFETADPEDSSFDWTRALTHAEAWDDFPTLIAIRDLIQDNVAAGYQLSDVRQQVEAFRSLTSNGARVSRILVGDPRLLDDHEMHGLVQFAAGHGGVFHIQVAPPSMLASNDVSTEFAAGIDALREMLASIASSSELMSTVPLLSADTLTTLGLPAQLVSLLPTFAARGTQADLANALVKRGFRIEELTSGAEAAVSSDDLLRASGTFMVGGMDGEIPLAPSCLSQIEDLAGVDLRGQLASKATANLKLTIGVDRHGFFLAAGGETPQVLLEVTTNALGQASAGLGEFGVVSGNGAVQATSIVTLNSPHQDGKLRLSDLHGHVGELFNAKVGGGADLSLNLAFKIAGEYGTGFSGRFQWLAHPDGSFGLSADSGFNQAGLWESLVSIAGKGIGALREGVDVLANLGAGIPLVGRTLAASLEPVIAAALDFDPQATLARLLASDDITVLSALTPRDFIVGHYLDQDLIRLEWARDFTAAPIEVDADRTLDYDVVVPISLALGGHLSVMPRIGFDFVIAVDANGPYVSEGSRVSAALPFSGSLSGQLSIGDLVGATAEATVKLDATIDVTLSDFDDVPHEKLRLIDSESEQHFDLDDLFVLHGGHATTISGGLIADLQLSLDANRIPVIGDLLSSALVWQASASYDLASRTGDYVVDPASLPSFDGFTDRLRNRFFGMLERYDPIPSDVRALLNKQIQILGNKSLAELFDMGPIEFLINPSALTEKSDAIDHHDSNARIALRIDAMQSMIDLLMGRAADLVRLDVDCIFETQAGTTLVPDTVLASFFGVFDIAASARLESGARVEFRGSMGLDTRGFYVLDDGPDRPLFRVAGELGLSVTIEGRIVVVPIARVTGTAAFQAYGQVDVVSANANQPQVYSNQLFHGSAINPAFLQVDVGLNLVLRLDGEVGLPEYGLSAKTPTWEMAFPLFRATSGVRQPGAGEFRGLHDRLEAAGRKLVCTIAIVAPNPISIGGCGALMWDKIADVVSDAARWIVDQANSAERAIEGAIEGMTEIVHDAGEAVEHVLEEIVTSGRKVARQIGRSFDDAINWVAGHTWHAVSPPSRYTFTVTVDGNHFTIQANTDAARFYTQDPSARLRIGMLGTSIIVQGPAFSDYVEVARKSDWRGRTKHKYEWIVQQNAWVLPSPSPYPHALEYVRVIGTDFDDTIVASHDLALPVIFEGLSGDDRLVAPDLVGGSTLIGGPGADVLIGGAQADFLDGGPGINHIEAGAGDDRVEAGNDGNYIDLGDGANYVRVGRGPDVIIGRAGDDWVDAGAGDNVIDVGGGNNHVTALDGNDVVVTLDGDDQIGVGDGRNFVRAGNGANRVSSGLGNDDIVTGEGPDQISAGGGTNSIFAGADDDLIIGGGQHDTLFGEDGNDTIYGGGGGDDVLDGGTGNDVIDTLSPSIRAGSVTVEFREDSRGHITGRVYNLDDPFRYRVLVYIRVFGDNYWPKPYFAKPLTSLGPDGYFDAGFITAATDNYASHVLAFVVPADYSVAPVSYNGSLPAELYRAAVARGEIERDERLVWKSWVHPKGDGGGPGQYGWAQRVQPLIFGGSGDDTLDASDLIHVATPPVVGPPPGFPYEVTRQDPAPQDERPYIELTHVPSYGTFTNLRGIVRNVVVPSDYKITVELFAAGGLWTKPSEQQPSIDLSSTGEFEVDVTAWGWSVDEFATAYTVLLLPAQADVPVVLGAADLPSALGQAAVARIDLRRPAIELFPLARSLELGPIIFAGEGDDSIRASSFPQVIEGGDGADQFLIGNSSGKFDGGGGADKYFLAVGADRGGLSSIQDSGDDEGEDFVLAIGSPTQATLEVGDHMIGGGDGSSTVELSGVELAVVSPTADQSQISVTPSTEFITRIECRNPCESLSYNALGENTIDDGSVISGPGVRNVEYSNARLIIKDDPAPTVQLGITELVSGKTVHFSADIVFSETVTGVRVEDFSILRDGVELFIGPLALQQVSETRYQIDLGDLTEMPGTYQVQLAANGVGIKDLAGQPLASDGAVSHWVPVSKWTNTINRLDCNGDGAVSPIDVLIVINEINSRAPFDLSFVPQRVGDNLSAVGFVDTNGDGWLTPLDALILINYLNEKGTSEGEFEESLRSPAIESVFHEAGATSEGTIEELWFSPRKSKRWFE